MPRRSPRQIAALVVLLLLAGLARPAAAAPACHPASPVCLEGRFRQFWEQQGGLAIFGVAIAPAGTEPDAAGRSHPTQWFERARLELHPEQPAPADMLLGRLGADRLQQLGRDWQAAPREPAPLPDCLWFVETGRNICNQAADNGFLRFWQAHGLELDGAVGASYAESIALWGLPLTSAQPETTPSGETVITQWFERARFEWHPGQAPQFQVLLGRLGAELGPAPAPAAPAAPAPDLRDRIVALVDNLHQRAGCAPFRRVALLDTAAQGHADDIAGAMRIDHVGSDGATLRQRLTRVGYAYRRASESIAIYPTPEQAVAMWMDEPPDGPHRRNIVDCGYVELGVGLQVDARGRRWWVIDFASPQPR